MVRFVLVSPVSAILLVVGLALARSAEIPPLPATPKKPVTDEHHGIKVVDEYRWLENASDPAVSDGASCRRPCVPVPAAWSRLPGIRRGPG
jgi:hypothetical protein